MGSRESSFRLHLAAILVLCIEIGVVLMHLLWLLLVLLVWLIHLSPLEYERTILHGHENAVRAQDEQLTTTTKWGKTEETTWQKRYPSAGQHEYEQVG